MTNEQTPGGLADVMASMPEVWRSLLAAHVPDRLGRCSSCRTASGAGERWPCTLHHVASNARDLYGQRNDEHQPVSGD